MKKFSLVFFVLAIFTLILAACGGNDSTNSDEKDASEEAVASDTAELEYEPEEIDPETDVCEKCAMAIADDQHATQIILKNDRSLKFDDLGCLYAWVEENGEDDIGVELVRDFHTKEWIPVDEATFVYDEGIETPMVYGVISFKDAADAEAYIDKHQVGETLTSADLADHKWEMMDHDQDHGHGDEHGEDHDGEHDEDHEEGH